MSWKSQIVFDLRMTTASEDTAKSRGLADEAIIFGVIADPEPQDSAFDINAEGAMVKADAARPKPAHALELQRRVTRIIFEKAVLLIRQALDRRSQVPETSPKLRGGEVPQNSVDFPAAWSRRASSASAPSFPAFASRSIWRSHAAASNSLNHRRNSASSSAERPEIRFSRASSLLIRRNDTIFSFRGLTLLPRGGHRRGPRGRKSLSRRSRRGPKEWKGDSVAIIFTIGNCGRRKSLCPILCPAVPKIVPLPRTAADHLM